MKPIKSIQDYLPIKSREHVLIQGRVPKHIADQVRDMMHSKNLSWADVLTACLQALIVAFDETETEKDEK